MSDSETAQGRRVQPLVVLSNRLPYNFARDGSGRKPKRNVGGLVSALEPVLASRRGMWVGWDGITSANKDQVQKAIASPRTIQTDDGVRLLGVPLSDRELQRYYFGFSNRTLWPLLHGLVDTTDFRGEYFDSYVEVNHRFVDMALEQTGSADQIWLHDYHLLLAPKILRDRGFAGRVDFFLHIPFPPPEVFRVLPWREALLDGMLAADTVVFHIDAYRDNFVSLTRELTRASVDTDADGTAELHLGGHSTTVASAPIGIDVDEFESISRRTEVAGRAQRIRKAHGNLPILFGADRLDYTKGILERCRAVERLLERSPSAAGTFSMLQIVVPSRHQVQEYRRLKESVDREVGRINGAYGRMGWQPIHYEYRALGREELVANYLAASVALVTPLKDGMNLVAPEFIASRTDERGVLVLSEFAGVASCLSGTLTINPYDADACATAIEAALSMPEDEQRRRMAGLRDQVRANTVASWADRCLRLGGAPQRRRPQRRGLGTRTRAGAPLTTPS